MPTLQIVLDVPRSARIQGFEMNVEIHLVLNLLSIALEGPELPRLPLAVALLIGKLLLQEDEGGVVEGGEDGSAAVLNDHLLAGLNDIASQVLQV